MDNINAIKEMIKFIIDLVKAIDKSVIEGPSVVDMMNFITPVIDAISAFRDIKELPQELKNLTEAQAQEICSSITASLDVTDKTNQIVIKSMGAAISLLDLYLFIKNGTAPTLPATN